MSAEKKQYARGHLVRAGQAEQAVEAIRERVKSLDAPEGFDIVAKAETRYARNDFAGVRVYCPANTAPDHPFFETLNREMKAVLTPFLSATAG